MEVKDYLCRECHVCSYCLQGRERACKHPVTPTRGHCPHYDDMRPDVCALCNDKEQITRLQLELSNAHTFLDLFEVPTSYREGNAWSLAVRIKDLVDTLKRKR